MYCSPPSCTLPSQHTIVEAQAVRRLPAFCILLQVFLPQDCPVWPLHLWWYHLASRIWWQVLLGLQAVKTPQNHHPLPLLLVSCVIFCALSLHHREENVTKWTVTLPCSSPYIPCHVRVNKNCFGFMAGKTTVVSCSWYVVHVLLKCVPLHLCAFCLAVFQWLVSSDVPVFEVLNVWTKLSLVPLWSKDYFSINYVPLPNIQSLLQIHEQELKCMNYARISKKDQASISAL